MGTSTPAEDKRRNEPFMKRLKLGLAITALIVVAGCATWSDTQKKTTAAIAQIAAKDATYFTLEENPKLRGGFEKAYADLSTLANAEKIELPVLLEIVHRLPVKELKGRNAQVIISDVQIVVQTFAPNNGQILSQENYANPRIVVQALRDGVRMGIDMAGPIP